MSLNTIQFPTVECCCKVLSLYDFDITYRPPWNKQHCLKFAVFKFDGVWVKGNKS